MENMRGVTAGSGRQSAQQESPEQLLDVFKAAALSVTKLYKTSAAAQSKPGPMGIRTETTGTGDGDGSKIRRWVRERLDGRESSSPNTESEDEIDKAETSSSPELTRPNTVAQQMSQMRTDSAPPSIPPTTTVEEQTPLVVPSQDNFTFQAAHPYPNIATLNLSDSRPHDGSSMTATRPSKTRLNNPGRACPRGPGHLAQRAGAKRKLNFEEIFDLGSLGGKDPFGNGGGKRGRHA
ncbi:hypothetical protein CEP52_007266 [Fusarium oligoseptatum]|uniref:Uncharacterized protein n=1 Tax=Fusarium oligoseptatum TaxID=2604345 RepID=A0A428TNQ0_9HYPO|nr:hypothetical protein CEP52_007266 [Fusarium oligoseptatum]